jgi:hypothetical protein
MHVHARACIFRQNDYRSEHLHVQMLDYHPGKFHIDPFKNVQKKKKKSKMFPNHNGKHNKRDLFTQQRI